MVYYESILFSLSIGHDIDIMEELLEILEKGFIHPLVRQYVTVIISKIYVFVTTKSQMNLKNEEINNELSS
jgi:hypothetical protein